MSENNSENNSDTQETNLEDRYQGLNFLNDSKEEKDKNQEKSEIETKEEKTSKEDKEDNDDEKEPKWFKKRINSITSKRKQAEEENARLKAELDKLKGVKTEKKQVTEDEIRADEQRKVHISNVTGKIAEDLAKIVGGNKVVPTAQKLCDEAGLDFDNPDHFALIEDISDYNNPGEVFKALADNPDEASDIFSAPARKQFLLLDKFISRMRDKSGKESGNVNKLAGVSKAPKPTNTPVSGSGGSGRSIYDADLSAEEYSKIREKSR